MQAKNCKQKVLTIYVICNIITIVLTKKKQKAHVNIKLKNC